MVLWGSGMSKVGCIVQVESESHLSLAVGTNEGSRRGGMRVVILIIVHLHENQNQHIQSSKRHQSETYLGLRFKRRQTRARR